MAQHQPSHYLESKILTASPPRLHLMLIEGAIRFGRKAEQHFEEGNEGYANESMVRSIDILGEMLAGVKHSKSEINKKLTDLYQFLFLTLTSAYVNTDAAKLADVLRILEFERETWQLACEKATEAIKDPEKSLSIAKSNSKPAAAAPIAPHLPSSNPVAGGLSLEA